MLSKTPIFSDIKIKDKEEFKKTIEYIQQFYDKEKWEEAFKKLNDRRDIEPNIAILLWYSTGCIAVLL